MSTFLNHDPIISALPLRSKGIFHTPLDWVGLWENLAQTGSAVLLESAGESAEPGRWVILAGEPQREYWGKGQDQWMVEAGISQSVSWNVFDFLDEIGKSQTPFSSYPSCLSSAWFGVFSYEFGKDLLLRDDRAGIKIKKKAPDFYFFKPGRILAFDRDSGEWYFWGKGRFEDMVYPRGINGSFQVGEIRALTGSKTYQDRIQKAKAYISQGDIYQTNLAQVFQADWKGNPASLYRLLREINPGPFMGLFQGKNFTIVSSSPERLVTGQGDWLEARPIAGTRPRGKNSLSDLRMKWELKTDSKEQAEHLMLVDLVRNDLGRVAQYGTVEVRDYARVESYAKVHHLVSVIKARRRVSAGFSEILRALFPGGTITGCPKTRCVEIIEELENFPRGFYTGSMGYVAPGSCFDFNILIRTFTLYSDGLLEFLAGAGIVADSDSEREYLETLFKVEALAQALGTSFISNV